jgi:hypothetical protein
MVIRRRKGLGIQYSNPSREWEPDSSPLWRNVKIKEISG